VHAGRNQLVLHRPPEGSNDLSGPLIDLAAAQLGVDDRLPHGHECQRAKVAGDRVAVQFPKRAQGETNVDRLCSRLPVLNLIAVRPVEISENQLVDRQINWRTSRGSS
jgi:hypothetical protein